MNFVIDKVRIERWALGLVLMLLNPTLSFSQYDDVVVERQDNSALIEGLRQRRLFATAEFYCREQLKRPELDPTSQVGLIIELMKTQTMRALLSPQAERAQAWSEVESTSTDFLTKEIDHPRNILVQVQQALSHIARGQMLSREIESQMADESARTKALMEIKIARTNLNDLQREISNKIPEQQGRTLDSNELAVDQLLNLKNNIQYQLAQCNLIRAQLYLPNDRLNRIDALNGVSEKLIEVQRLTSEGQTLWWNTKLGQIECYRLLNTPDRARTLAQSLEKFKAPLLIKQRLAEQTIRNAIAIGDTTYAQSTFANLEQFRPPTPDLELALLELAIALSASTTDKQKKQNWISRAFKRSQAIKREYGPYWGRRAELILINTVGVPVVATGNNSTGTSQTPPNVANQPKSIELELLIRLATEAERKKEWKDALNALQRGSDLAKSQADFKTVLNLEIRLAKILEGQGKHKLAADRLTTNANEYATQPVASAAHLIGCWNYAKSISAEDPNSRPAFQTLLIQHLDQWPTAASSNQARIWLAKERINLGDWERGLELYLAVTNSYPQLNSAIEQAIACARQTLQLPGNATQLKCKEVIAQLSLRAGRLPSNTTLRSELELAQFELDWQFGTRLILKNNQDQVKQIANGTSSDNVNWANALLVALNAESDPKTATQYVAAIADNQRMLQRCEPLLNYSPADETANQNLQTVKLDLTRAVLALPEIQQPDNAKLKDNWRLKQAAVLIALKQNQKASQTLTALEKKYPRNAEIQMQLARSLTGEFGTSQPEIPLKKWRRIATRLKKNTPNWYEAKYQVAQLLFNSGDRESAAKLLKYIKAIPPGWNQSELKSQFESLLRKSTQQ
jgi:TolA-binding protein